MLFIIPLLRLFFPFATYSVSNRKCLCLHNIIRLINHPVTQFHSRVLIIIVSPVTELGGWRGGV